MITNEMTEYMLTEKELDAIRERIVAATGAVYLTEFTRELLEDRWNLYNYTQYLLGLLKRTTIYLQKGKS